MAKYQNQIKKVVDLQSVQGVPFSVCMMKNPMNENDPKKAYAAIQYNGKIQLDQLAAHIKEHGSVYSRGVIVGVITEMVDCIAEYLKKGFQVELGDLGVISLSIAQRAAKTAAAFDGDNITDCYARFTPGGRFCGMRPNMTFVKTVSRTVQAAVDKLVKDGTISAEEWQGILDGEITVELDDNGNVTPVTPETP